MRLPIKCVALQFPSLQTLHKDTQEKVLKGIRFSCQSRKDQKPSCKHKY